MGKMGYVFLGVLSVSLALWSLTGNCADSGSNTSDEIGRYQIYTTQNILVLLDTKTGKMWKISSDMSGKLKADGVGVEGVAYSSTELDALNSKLKDINFDGVPERDRKRCMDELIAVFSYIRDQDKIDKIMSLYKTKKE